MQRVGQQPWGMQRGRAAARRVLAAAARSCPPRCVASRQTWASVAALGCAEHQLVFSNCSPVNCRAARGQCRGREPQRRHCRVSMRRLATAQVLQGQHAEASHSAGTAGPSRQR